MTTGAVRCAKLQSNHNHQQTNTQLFYRSDAFPVIQPTVSKHLMYHITLCSFVVLLLFYHASVCPVSPSFVLVCTLSLWRINFTEYMEWLTSISPAGLATFSFTTKGSYLPWRRVVKHNFAV